VVEGAPRQLLSSASTTVPLVSTVDATGTRVALGLAASNGRPLGFLLDLDTLHTERSTLGWAPSALRRVVPLTGEEELSVALETDSVDPAEGRSYAVRASRPMSLGTYRGHLVLSAGEGVPEVLWALPEGASIERADAAAGPRGEGAVALRAGDEVFLGTFDAAQRPVGNLEPISGTRAATGSVRVGWNGSRAVVAFDTAEGVRLASRARSVKLGGAPGLLADDLDIVGVSDGRWAVSWTEREASKSRVRLGTMDAELRAIGTVTDVSLSGEEASGATIAASGARGAVFYFKRGVSLREAWVTAIRCP